MISKYILPELPYEYAALEPHYSREILELHHDKHHAAYVKGANSTLERLGEARSAKDYDALNQLQKDFAFHLSGHLLHSLFWRNMSPDGGSQAPGDLAAAIERDFGGDDQFREQMTRAALSIQGSGWAALSWEPLGQRLVVEQIYDHQGNTGNATIPLLVLDMWEHAFYLQFHNEKAAWVDAFWDIVNWTDVAERFLQVRALNLYL